MDATQYGAFFDALRTLLGDASTQYQQSAPTVSRWADDLYIRLDTNGDLITLSEVAFAVHLHEDGYWLDPNLAANLHYKLLNRLGRSTTGLLGF